MALSAVLALSLTGTTMTQRNDDPLDVKVKAFLSRMQHRWQDLNVPQEDGEALRGIVLKGVGFGPLSPQFLALGVYVAAVLGLASIRLAKERG